MKPTVKTIANQPSWIIRSKDVELAITQLGGHMAPVKFYRRSANPIQPYYISPWQREGGMVELPVLRPLRGDFFCMPLGGGSYHDEEHTPHGETASSRWRLVGTQNSGRVTSLTLSVRTKVRRGKVTKTLGLIDGHNVVYVRHVLEGFSGRMPLGHHATLAMPQEPRSVNVALSPYRFGLTNPASPGDPAAGEYYSLAVNKRFKDLAKVPTIWRDQPVTDCTAFPTRHGYTDILTCVAKAGNGPSWTTATFTTEGFLWFSLKPPDLLPSTLLWVSNRGRHGAPWDGRNCCLGLEEVCSYLAEGIGSSLRANALSKAGVATAMKLSPKHATTIPYIQGVVRVPRGFDKVRGVRFARGKVTFTGKKGKTATARVKHEFLQTGEL